MQVEGRENSDLTIKLLRHDWSGKARVTVNNKVNELDLFSSSGDVAVLTFPSVGIGDEVVRAYEITTVDTPWQRLKFISEGEDKVKVEEIKVRGHVITPQGNGEYILPFRFWNKLSCTIFSTTMSWLWMTMLFVSTVHLWQGQPSKRFGIWTYIICLSVTLGDFGRWYFILPL